jgi:hypothetical protein
VRGPCFGPSCPGGAQIGPMRGPSSDPSWAPGGRSIASRAQMFVPPPLLGPEGTHMGLKMGLELLWRGGPYGPTRGPHIGPSWALAQLGAQMGPRMVPKWIFEGAHMGSIGAQIRARHGPCVDPKHTPNGPRMDPDWGSRGAQRVPKRTDAGPHTAPMGPEVAVEQALNADSLRPPFMGKAKERVTERSM